jgi:threonine dehydratase
MCSSRWRASRSLAGECARPCALFGVLSPAHVTQLWRPGLAHVLHSFKARGAFNKVLRMRAAIAERGVIAASTGNHGLAVAEALAACDLRGTIWAPSSIASGKRQGAPVLHVALLSFHSLAAALERFAGTVALHLLGDDCIDTEVAARRAADEAGAVFISPYNDADVVAGQGTVAAEMLEQCPGVGAVFVSVGGGGLIGGMAAWIKAKRPDVRVVGCQVRDLPVVRVSG